MGSTIYRSTARTISIRTQMSRLPLCRSKLRNSKRGKSGRKKLSRRLNKPQSWRMLKKPKKSRNRISQLRRKKRKKKLRRKMIKKKRSLRKKKVKSKRLRSKLRKNSLRTSPNQLKSPLIRKNQRKKNPRRNRTVMRWSTRCPGISMNKRNFSFYRNAPTTHSLNTITTKWHRNCSRITGSQTRNWWWSHAKLWKVSCRSSAVSRLIWTVRVNWSARRKQNDCSKTTSMSWSSKNRWVLISSRGR